MELKARIMECESEVNRLKDELDSELMEAKNLDLEIKKSESKYKDKITKMEQELSYRLSQI